MKREKLIELHGKLRRMYDELEEIKDTLCYNNGLAHNDPDRFYVGIVYGHTQSARDSIGNAYGWIQAGFHFTQEEQERGRNQY